MRLYDPHEKLVYEPRLRAYIPIIAYDGFPDSVPDGCSHRYLTTLSRIEQLLLMFERVGEDVFNECLEDVESKIDNNLD